MNRNVLWTLGAVGLFILSYFALGNDGNRNAVAWLGVAVSLAVAQRYAPRAFAKYVSGATAGEWRLLMGLELAFSGYGAREIWLLFVRDQHSPVWMTTHWVNAVFAYWVLCGGLLCLSAVNDPVPTLPHQNVYILGAVAIASGLTGALVYRLLWG